MLEVACLFIPSKRTTRDSIHTLQYKRHLVFSRRGIDKCPFTFEEWSCNRWLVLIYGFWHFRKKGFNLSLADAITPKYTSYLFLLFVLSYRTHLHVSCIRYIHT